MSPHEPLCSGAKTCVKCGLSKPALHFPAHKSSLDGLDSWCRECHRKYDKGREKRKFILKEDWVK